MQFDTALRLAERSPPEYTQAQIYDCRIEGIYISINDQKKVLVLNGSFSCQVDQMEGKLFEDSAVTILICFCEVRS